MVVQLCDPKSTAAAPVSHRAALLRRSGPGCAREAGPSGLAAMSSGRAGLPGKRSCPRAGGQVELESGKGSAQGSLSRRLHRIALPESLCALCDSVL